MSHQFFSPHLLGKEEHEATFYPKEFEQLETSPTSALGLKIASDCPYSQEVINKFESRVCILDNGCWFWKGGKDGQGLGRFCIRKNKHITTARAAFKIYREDFGDRRDVWIVRTCACPTVGCCNPFHLEKSDHPLQSEKRSRQAFGKEIGVHTRFQKGKQSLKGTESKFAKLTEQKVIEIRIKRLRDNVTFRELAAQYRVSIRLIQKIVKGQAWPHIPIKLEDCLQFGNSSEHRKASNL